MALCVALACCPCASALDPSLDISQYAHTVWTVRQGFSLGNIYAMAQTPDGYLWLGTEFGLIRFDGVRSIAWQAPAGQHLPEKNMGEKQFNVGAVVSPKCWRSTNSPLSTNVTIINCLDQDRREMHPPNSLPSTASLMQSAGVRRSPIPSESVTCVQDPRFLGNAPPAPIDQVGVGAASPTNPLRPFQNLGIP